MAASIFIEQESGTYTHPIHRHNGYYAGDFFTPRAAWRTAAAADSLSVPPALLHPGPVDSTTEPATSSGHEPPLRNSAGKAPAPTSERQRTAMNEIHAALVLHETRQGAQAYRPTHHTHSARVFRLSRPGLIGTLALLPGDSRMNVVRRSSR